MTDVIYCHQCAKDNSAPTKFCRHCHSPSGSKDWRVRYPVSAVIATRIILHLLSFAVDAVPRWYPTRPKPDPMIPIALNSPKAMKGDSCPACGRQTQLVAQYVDQLRTHNASQTVRVNVGTTHAVRVPGQRPVFVNSDTGGTLTTGATIRIPAGLFEPRAGCLSANLNSLATVGSGCFVTLLLLGIIPILLPFAQNNVIINLVLALGIGFFVASRIQKWLISPFRTQMENARARWRRSRICLRCDAVFVPNETIYTSPNFLNRLVWYTQKNS